MIPAVALLLLMAPPVEDVAELSRVGAQAMRERRFAEAIRAYRDLALKDAANPMWHFNLGMALQSAGEDVAALAEFGVFLRAKPEPGPAHFFVGLARLRLDQACEGVEPLEKARRWRASIEVLVELGDAYHGCKRWTEAAGVYSEAARLKPRNSRLPRQAARCWWLARRYDKARAAYAAIARAHGGEAEFLFEYGDTLARVEGARAGLGYLEKAVAAAPGLLPARGALGRALLDLGRAAEAVPHLEAAASADAAAWLPLSRAYKAVGRMADAAAAEAQYRKGAGE